MVYLCWPPAAGIVICTIQRRKPPKGAVNWPAGLRANEQPGLRLDARRVSTHLCRQPDPEQLGSLPGVGGGYAIDCAPTHSPVFPTQEPLGIPRQGDPTLPFASSEKVVAGGRVGSASVLWEIL